MPLSQVDAGFDCITWVRDALGAAEAAGCFGRSAVAWGELEEKAAVYIREKIKEGRWKKGGLWDVRVPATWSFVEGREVVS